MTTARAIACGLLALAGCGGSPAHPDAGDGPGHVPGTPGLGAHGLTYYKFRASSPASISSPKLDVQATGSTIVTSIGRGDKTLFVLPTDNKGNSPYTQLDTVHNYDPLYPDSGTAVYAHTAVKGGGDFQLTTSTTTDDEITVATVEILDGSKIVATAWNELSNAPLTTKSVTTTGPATLVAFWWGDGFFENPSLPQKATANNDFTVIDTNASELDSFVQCVVAVKNVAAAGTYDVTWTATPAQGAQLWLIAVQ